MGTLLLVRHGQSSWGGAEDGTDEEALTPLGWEQSRLLGAALAARGVAPDLVVHAGRRMHRETVEALTVTGAWGARTTVDERWADYDHGEVLRAHLPTMVGGGDPDPQQFQQWLQMAMMRWTSGDHDDYAESFAAFTRRTQAALSDAADRVGRTGTIVVVTSGGPVAWLTAAMVGLWDPASDPAELAGPWTRLTPVVVNTSLTKVTVGLRGVRLVSFNEHSHLETGPAPVC
ncbi:histidine phosphatase family protein [Nocardioides zeae]|uniref:Histidine phosphatase family protein n=1 Tax=Nocardioides zeae TaxID=1457234 RepID=A0A6P0HH46_9ACTN|nr:histidine phosphatase family protein [Nocardioides zeae]NEN77958.1 histidine phosphatase family protein [Nocardioides zeae]